MAYGTGKDAKMFFADAMSRRQWMKMGAAGALIAASQLSPRAARAQAWSTPEPVDEHRLKQLVDDAHTRFASVADGKNADYIPYLASVPSHLFGIAMVTPEGKVIEAGDTNYAFAIESVAKVFTLALVMSGSGPDVVKQKLGSSGTGLPFNSVIALELHKGNPLSPLVNAGAMATVSLVKGMSADERWQKISKNMDDFADAELSLNKEVFKSESDTNQHNRAIAYLLDSAKFMYSDPMEAATSTPGNARSLSRRETSRSWREPWPMAGSIRCRESGCWKRPMCRKSWRKWPSRVCTTPAGHGSTT